MGRLRICDMNGRHNDGNVLMGMKVGMVRRVRIGQEVEDIEDCECSEDGEDSNGGGEVENC